MVFIFSSNYTNFLEKLTSMFEKITQRLPAYKEHFDRLGIQKKERPEEPLLSGLGAGRLVKALSLIYEDIISFCQQACKILLRRKESHSGVKFKPSVIHDVFWKPFDARFSSLLSRLGDHQDLFECELRLEDSKRYQRQMENTKLYEKNAANETSKIKALLEILKGQNDREEERNTERFRRLDDEIAEIQRRFKENCQKIDDANQETLSKTVRELKHWINAPNYQRVIERARQIRMPETANWISATKPYITWYDQPLETPVPHGPTTNFSTPSSFASRVLLLQAKPGYGKTTMSSAIIDQLQSDPETLIHRSPVQRNVSFYHFDAKHTLKNDIYQAFRSILVQLLHQNRHSEQLIDGLSLLMDSTGTGQETASDYDVKQALQFIAAYLPGTFVVIDGVDECAKPHEFLTQAHDIFKDCLIKIIFLSRPNIQLPREYQDGIIRIELTANDNEEDIARYVRSEVENLQICEALTGPLSKAEIIESVSSRANGMFLWAFLMIKYLQCPGLSQSERLEALQESSILEGLDVMYTRILKVLRTAYSKEQQRVHRIFQLLVVAIRPVRAEEIEIGIAIQPGSVTSAFDFVPRFAEALPLICGALVEIGSGGRVSFIHSSVIAFLTYESTSLDPTISQFHVDRGIANALFGKICLSHLIYDITQTPPSIAPTVPEYSNAIQPLRDFSAFICYALHWPEHIRSALTEYEKGASAAYDQTWKDIVILTSKFLHSPISISTWIEASWNWKKTPSIKHLVDSLRELPLRRKFPSTIGSEEGLEVIRHLWRFSTDLVKINADWGYLLVADPSAIWGPSITAFAKSEFLLRNNETTVTILEGPESTETSHSILDWITIASHTSRDGNIVGIINLRPSLQYFNSVRSHSKKCHDDRGFSFPKSVKATQDELKALCREWKVNYTGRSTKDNSIVFSIEVVLPEDQIASILRLNHQFSISDRFPFPVSFSPDLSQILVLQLIIRRPTTHNRVIMSEERSIQFQTQSLYHDQRTKSDDQYVIHNSLFSANSKWLAIIEGAGRPGRPISWRVSVWWDKNPGQPTPRFVYKGHVQPSHLDDFMGKRTVHLAFHPSLPCLAFPRWGTTSIWWFGGNRLNPPENVSGVTLGNLKFTKYELEGELIAEPTDYVPTSATHAVELENNFLEAPDESGRVREDPSILPEPYSSAYQSTQVICMRKILDRYITREALDIDNLVDEDLFVESESSTEQPVLTHNLSIATRASDDLHLLTPFQRQSVFDMDVVQDPTRRTYSTKDFSFNLPQPSTMQNTSLSFIRPHLDDGWLKVVWNKGLQIDYSILDVPSQRLPVIIKRKRHLADPQVEVEEERLTKRICAPAEDGEGR